MVTYSKPVKVKLIPDRAPLLTGPLFTKIETCPLKFIVCQGGGDAGKTITILHWLAVKAIQTKNTQISVVGMDVPNLKRGSLRAFKRYVKDNPQIAPYIQFYNKTDREYHFKNGSVISFVSFDDDEDARGAENDFVFINEANMVSYNLFWELQRKCRGKVILDFNPTFAFWVHAKLINGGEAQFVGRVQLYITDHRHNPFLTEDQHANYENISDPEKFKVYARGHTGKTTGSIFSFGKVTALPVIKDSKGVPIPLKFGFGVDIGYTSDKTAIVKVWMNGKDHYYQELLYKSNDEIQNEINDNGLIDERGLPMTVEKYIKNILVANGMTMSSMIWGDHDKSMSNKLRRLQVPYRMARKGPNSVVASISSVKRSNGFMFNSPTLEEECKTYIWQTAVDVLTGNEVTTGVPIDGMPDHLIAAVRYFEHSNAMRMA